MPEGKEFVIVHDLHKSFGEGDTRQRVLRGTDFAVDRGEFCVLLGPSGSGKSTLLNIIGGIDTPDDGYVSIAGTGFIKMFIFVFIGYLIVLFFDYRRIRKVPMDEALKMME